MFLGVWRRMQVFPKRIVFSFIFNLDDVMNLVVGHVDLQKSIIQTTGQSVFLYLLLIYKNRETSKLSYRPYRRFKQKIKLSRGDYFYLYYLCCHFAIVTKLFIKFKLIITRISMGFDIDRLLEKVLKCQILEQQAIHVLCHRLKDILIQEKNVQKVSLPITVVGDVHGQFFDVLQIFKVGGELPYTNYLFLGDYVDRGAHSVQTITLLCLLKLKYPSKVLLIRGNHQLRAITQNYGFYMQCQNKYGNTIVWQQFTDLFDFFPISAIVADNIFAVHGGLSPMIESVDQIQSLNRFQEIPHDGPLCDLMWSDPEEGETGFVVSPRGAGYIFGEEVLQKFLHHNGFNHLTRAHQLCTEGYQLLFKDALSTVWSAPNYVYRMGNMASIMEIDQFGNRSFNIFAESPENIARGIVAAAADAKIIKNETEKYFM